jgi:hypothetical protein
MSRLSLPAVTLVLTLAGVLASPAAATPPTLDYACSPAPAGCLGWYRSAVNLSWDWNQLVASPSAGTCSATAFTADTKGTQTFCEVEDNGTQEKTRITLVIHIDQTPPTVTEAVPERPPDHAGWFNHPVTFSFQGGDATSGLQSCTSTTYSGPNGAAVLAPGSCRDVAGNVGVASFALNYDATPPSAPDPLAIPGNRLMRIEWSEAQGADAFEVVRVGRGGPALLYRGTGHQFVERGLKNGVSRRYRVTAIDSAGNRAASEVRATPTSSPLLTPAQGSRLKRPPLLIWKKTRRASYYNVQLFRAGRKVLTRWPRTNRVQLRRNWRFAGRKRRLVPGRYAWYVWPGYGKRAARDYGRVLGKRSFVITR